MFPGDGQGNFGTPTSIPTLEHNGYWIETWDASVDGKLDLLASELSDMGTGGLFRQLAAVEAHLGNGDGTFGSGTAHSLGLTSAATISSPYFASGDVDLNRDGVVDVVTANGTSGNVSVLLHHASLVTGVATVPDAAPIARLWQNYPNPFNPTTTIRYTVRETGRVRLNVFDIHGRLVVKLVDEVVPAGDHAAAWRGRTDHGSPVASGVYFYRLTTESGHDESRRMVVMK